MLKIHIVTALQQFVLRHVYFAQRDAGIYDEAMRDAAFANKCLQLYLQTGDMQKLHNKVQRAGAACRQALHAALMLA